MADDECVKIHSLTESEFWNFLEDSMESGRKESMKMHAIHCRPCLEFFARATQRAQENDPKRYALFHNEVMAVRRAELLRLCNKLGKEVDISQIKTPDDYFRLAFAAMIPEHAGSFMAAWDEMTADERDDMVLEIIQLLHEEPN